MDCGSIDHSYPSLPATSVINHSSCRKISHWSNQIVGNKNATKIGKTPSTYTLSRTSILQENIKSLQPSMPFYFVVSTSKNRKQPSNNNNDEVLANEQRYRYHYSSRYKFHIHHTNIVPSITHILCNTFSNSWFRIASGTQAIFPCTLHISLVLSTLCLPNSHAFHARSIVHIYWPLLDYLIKPKLPLSTVV